MSKSNLLSLKNLGLLAGILTTALIYFPLNHGIVKAHVVAGPLDARLPVVPFFAIPYLAALPIFWLVVLYAWLTGKQFIKLAAALIIVFGVSDVIYLAFPTYMLRPHQITGIFAGLVRWIYQHDQPYNDLPSEHMAMITLLTLYFWQWGWKARLLTGTFALIVAVSVLLIKQHSIIGALSGLFLAAATWLALEKLVFKKRPT